MNEPTNTAAVPCQLARASWIAGILAVGLVVLTASTSARVIGELTAFMLIGGGMVAGMVALATIPKFGSKHILWPAVAGITVNGLLLAIAIPNYVHARQRALEQNNWVEKPAASFRQPVQPEANEQRNSAGKKSAGWHPYRLAGLEILSPIQLTNVDIIGSLRRAQKYTHATAEQAAIAEESAKLQRMKAYGGQRAGFAVKLEHQTLPQDQAVTVESAASQFAQSMRQAFPKGFQSKTRDLIIDGVAANRLTLQYQTQGGTAKIERIIVINPPNIWSIQIFGPADMPHYSETVEKIFGSIKFLPGDTEPVP